MIILFVIRSTRTFHYHRSIIATLLKRGHTVRVLFDYEWSKTKVGALDVVDAFKKEFPQFEYGWALQRNDWWKKILFPAREIRSYRRYLLVRGQSEYYKERWMKYIPYKLKLLIRWFPFLNAILRLSIIGTLLEWVEKTIPADKEISAFLTEYRPDVLVASPVNLRHSSADLEYVKAARALGIPTAVQVISWDNLTTKGIFHVIPDILLVWNKTQVGEAREHHGIPEERIRITGAPVFDEWFQPLRPSKTREAFCAEWGLSPRRPILLYLGSTKNIAENESWLVKKIRAALDRSPNPRMRETELIVRPHPAHFKIYDGIEGGGITIVPKQSSLPSTDKALQLFYDSAYYSVATIGINTSGMIDAILAGKPGMAYLTPEYAKTQSETEHFKYLVRSDAIDIVHSDEEFLKTYQAFLDGADPKAEKRKQFIADYIRPHGPERSAGSVAAEEIETLGMS